MQAVNQNVKLLPGSNDVSATAVVEGNFTDVRIVISRTEPDTSDDDLLAACSCEVRAVDRTTGKVLAFTMNDEYSVHGSLKSHVMDAVREGDFDEGIQFVLKQAAKVLGAAADDKVKFIVSHAGDNSAGIPGDKAEVLLDASGFNAEDRAEFIESARAALANAFASIWEFKPSVHTEAELQADEPRESGAGYSVQPTELVQPESNDRAPVPGFVLAFPGASDAEADELVTMLKAGGNTVVRVEGEAAALALHAGLEQAGLKADDFQP